ncbi:heparin sulfate O-sulfotransferase [Athalia rosae]|uniref:heparin sulfate O-sulfotransferase n=1 Tax=Athalia rosae TaxID=37344 RepID=UPI002033601F|nr:heparin sulfate O-sulfotransferase [Athalia rosae]
MVPRSISVQWITAVSLFFIILYLKVKINYLEESTRTLQNALVQVQKQNNGAREIHKEHESQPDFEDVVVIYNRVPKTGSTSFVGIVYDLCKQNKYHSLHINVTNNMHTLTLLNQVKFVNNITRWDAMKPAFYHGHIAFLNFAKFGVQRAPLYINLLRKPLDRFVSYYYFLRYGDNFRPHLIRKKHGDTKTFDECVELGQPDCDPNNMWLQVPFLCGHEPGCWEVGSQWALAEAKRNLEQHYLLVGVTEELSDFVQILQAILPRFFKGAYHHFTDNSKSHLRQTTQKVDPLPETVEKIKKSQVWQMEMELYVYALNHFHAVKKRIVSATPQEANQHFMYEKIRPK